MPMLGLVASPKLKAILYEKVSNEFQELNLKYYTVDYFLVT